MHEILILSDSHGNIASVREVVKKHPSASYVLFCGDGLRDIETLESEFSTKIFLSVKGNCDLFYDAPDTRMIPLGGHNVFMTHGHLFGVKSGYGVLAKHARDQGADIVLFGHTHLPFEGRMTVGDHSVHLFNPGSIGRSFDGALSYGVLTLRENGYLFSHGDVTCR